MEGAVDIIYNTLREKGKERLATALREQRYPVRCLCWGSAALVLALARILTLGRDTYNIGGVKKQDRSQAGSSKKGGSSGVRWRQWPSYLGAMPEACCTARTSSSRSLSQKQ